MHELVTAIEGAAHAVAQRATRRIPAFGRKFVGEDDRDKVFNEILGQIKDIFARLRMGFFKPEPRDEKLCDRCQWSRVCRAPHLK